MPLPSPDGSADNHDGAFHYDSDEDALGEYLEVKTMMLDLIILSELKTRQISVLFVIVYGLIIVGSHPFDPHTNSQTQEKYLCKRKNGSME